MAGGRGERREPGIRPGMQPGGGPKARGGVVVFLNSDTVVASGWLDELLAPFEATDVGAVGPCSDNVSGRQKVLVPFPILKRTWRIRRIRQGVADQPPGGDLRGTTARWYCLAVRTSSTGLSEDSTSGSRSADSRTTTCAGGCSRTSFGCSSRTAPSSTTAAMLRSMRTTSTGG